MDLIVNRLSDIETAAVRIMEGATADLAVLDQESNARLKDFDSKIEKQTKDKLEALKSRLYQEMEQELTTLKASAEQQTATMELEYKKNHEKLAAQLLKKMIEE